MTLSILPLLVSTFAAAPPAAEVNLLAGLPSHTFAALHIPNPKALIARRETSRWVAFATDAQWDPLLRNLLSSFGEEASPEEFSAWRERVLGSLADSTGMVAFVAGSPKDDGPDLTLGLLVEGGEESARLLRRFVGDDATPTPLAGGQEVLLSQSGRAELYYESNGLILLLSTPKMEGSLSIAEACLSSLAKGDSSSLFDLPGVAELRPGAPSFEFVADSSPFFEAIRAEQPDMDPFQERTVDAFATVRWMYSSMEIGVGEVADWNVYAPYATESMLGSALAFFGEADTSLLAHAPIEAISATVGAFDVNGFSKWVLEQVEEASEDLHAQALAGLSGIQAATGVDLMASLIGNITGQFLGFSSAPEVDPGDASQMLMGMSDPQTLVVFVDDGDPYLDLIDSLIGLTGMDSEITSETLALPGDRAAEMDLYRFQADEEISVDLAVGVGDGRVMLSSDPKARVAYFDLLGGKTSAKSVLDDPDRKQALAAASGALITIQPTLGFADLIEGLSGYLTTMAGLGFIPDQDPELNLEEESLAEDISYATKGVADLIRQYFSGTMTSELKVGNGLIHMQTAAR